MNRKTFLTCLCLAATSLICGAEPEKRSEANLQGQAKAQADIKAGKLGLEVFGLRAFSEQTYRRLLKERYNIEVRAVAGCIVSSQIIDHARGYNEIMNVEITERFGEDIFGKTQHEAAEIAKKETQ